MFLELMLAKKREKRYALKEEDREVEQHGYAKDSTG
jgi:hypothetical protein